MKNKIKIFGAILLTVGSLLSFGASAAADAYTPQSIYLALTTQIKGTLSVKGDPVPGSVLTADITYITPKSAALQYQWYRDTEEIYGGYYQAYTVTENDVGHHIWVVVSGWKNFGGEITSTPMTILEKPQTPPEVPDEEENVNNETTLPENKDEENTPEEKKTFERINEYKAGVFTDVDEGNWYGLNNQKSVKEAYEFGIMTGTSDTTFEPDGNVTIAQAITIAARIHNYSLGGKHTFAQTVIWYKSYETYAKKNGILQNGIFSDEDMQRAATRAEIAYILSNALGENELENLNSVTALPDVNESTLYSESIFKLYNAGILIGNDPSGIFYPEKTVTRAEAATIITRLILPENRKTVEFTPN